VTAGTGTTFWSKAQGRFWELGEKLREPNIRYAIKVGVAGGGSFLLFLLLSSTLQAEYYGKADA